MQLRMGQRRLNCIPNDLASFIPIDHFVRVMQWNYSSKDATHRAIVYPIATGQYGGEAMNSGG